ncbi:MAG: molybdopterin-dependent oxidoreductase, partial [Rhodospirillaceae bacterium]|nr:molybdopterin-dependent oxidoreductase [Rhodospirillaceae bacterium]
MGISRRKAILSTLAAGGALIVGYALWPYPQRDKARAILGDNTMLTTWLKIAPDNRITIVVNHSDMGQGSQTALAQMLADELDADWDLVSVIEAPAQTAFANGEIAQGFLTGEIELPKVLAAPLSAAAPSITRMFNLQITGGSASIRYTGTIAMRPAGAAAREMLMQAAAAAWNVPARELTTKLSHVHHEPSGRKMPYGELTAAAAKMSPSASPRLKSPEQFTLMGKPVKRFDIPEKVNGTAQYGTDTRLDGMKYAAIKQSPVFGGEVESFDENAIKSMPGVLKVVKLNGAVAVVADNTWRAMQAVKALPVTFKGGASVGLSIDDMFAGFETAVAGLPAKDDLKQGDVDSAFKGAVKIVEATYRAPFLAHAPMEPLSCTVIARSDGTAECWVGSQNPLGARAAVAKTLDVDDEKVTLHNLRMGGGFGRRSDTDWIIQTTQIAAEMKDTPIKLVWSREEDMQHDKFRPAGLSRFKGGLDKDDNPVGWMNVYNWKDEPAKAALVPYAVAHQHIGWVDATAPVPTGAWRSVAHSRHGFFTESFADEMAHAAGMDPFTFRKKLLADMPRHLAVLNRAAVESGWGLTLPPGRGRGIAIHE